MSETAIRSTGIVTVFGGSGFVGRHTVRALAKAGWRIRVATRRPDLAFHLQPLGEVGQIHAVQANVRYAASVAAAMRGAEAVVNLVGIQVQKGAQTFEATHVAGARAIAGAALDAGIRNFVQLSGIGADAESGNAYIRSKGRGDAAVREVLPEAVLLQPSVIFGPEDQFLNRFAAIARMAPVLPLFGGGEAKMQPVYVGDVAQAVARALANHAMAGATYELGGPEVVTLKDVFKFVCHTIGRKRWLAPTPNAIANVMAFGTEIANKLSLGLFPQTLLLTRDQVALLAHDNVVSEAAIAEGRTLAGLSIQPEAIESIAPAYLARFRRTGQFGKPTHA